MRKAKVIEPLTIIYNCRPLIKREANRAAARLKGYSNWGYQPHMEYMLEHLKHMAMERGGWEIDHRDYLAAMVPRHMAVLREMPEYQLAKQVLIVDDGMATSLGDSMASDGKNCYYLQVGKCYVLRGPHNRLPLQLEALPHVFRPLDELPSFDLFVTGCHGIYQNKVYTGGTTLVRTLDRLKEKARITAQTTNVVMALRYQWGHKMPNVCFLKAPYVVVDGFRAAYCGLMENREIQSPTPQCEQCVLSNYMSLKTESLDASE